MPEIGDRVGIAGNKVGQAQREGTVRAKTGNLIRVEWDSGEESTMLPAPGVLNVLPKGRGGKKAVAKKAAVSRGVAAKQPTGTKKGAAVKSAVTKSPASARKAPAPARAAAPKKAAPGKGAARVKKAAPAKKATKKR